MDATFESMTIFGKCAIAFLFGLVLSFIGGGVRCAYSEEKSSVYGGTTGTYRNTPSSFDPNKYVSENCINYRGGVVSPADLDKINQDQNLTSAQKEAAKSELDRMASLYY